MISSLFLMEASIAPLLYLASASLVSKSLILALASVNFNLSVEILFLSASEAFSMIVIYRL